MNGEIPRAVVTGRRVAMTLLAFATLITVFAAIWLIAAWITQPIAV
ncbi:MAG TPA: hypothetical protein VGL06_07075 [Pseudonocardiaceae bacterium]|jgi:hypothetical protein